MSHLYDWFDAGAIKRAFERGCGSEVEFVAARPLKNQCLEIEYRFKYEKPSRTISAGVRQLRPLGVYEVHAAARAYDLGCLLAAREKLR